MFNNLRSFMKMLKIVWTCLNMHENVRKWKRKCTNMFSKNNNKTQKSKIENSNIIQKLIKSKKIKTKMCSTIYKTKKSKTAYFGWISSSTCPFYFLWSIPLKKDLAELVWIWTLSFLGPVGWNSCQFMNQNVSKPLFLGLDSVGDLIFYFSKKHILCPQ